MKTKRQYIFDQIIIYILVIVSILVLVYFHSYVNKKQKADVTIKLAELTDIDNQVTEAEKVYNLIEKNVDSINKNLKSRKKEVNANFESLLNPSNDYNLFIEDLQNKAKEFGIIIQNSIYDLPIRTANSGIYYEFQFNAIFTGEYNKMKQFLWELENNMKYLVNVTNIEIVPPVCDNQGNISFKLSISTFFLSYN